MCYMLIFFLLTIEVVRVTGVGFCDQDERPSNTPDFYAVNMKRDNGQNYKLYWKVEENIYKSEGDGKELYRDQDGYWNLNIFKSTSNTSVPMAGRYWKNVRSGKEIFIEN